MPVFLLTLMSCGSDPELKITDGPEAVYSDDSSGITIIWETNVPGDSRVMYGLTQALEKDTVLIEERKLHEVPMYWLQADTLYYYRVRSGSDYFEGLPTSAVFTFRTNRWVQELSPEAYVSLGWTSWASGNYLDAYTSFSAALNKNSNYIPAYEGLGWSCLHLNGRDEEAYDAFNDALYRDAGACDGRVGRAVLYIRREQYVQAGEDLEFVLDIEANYRSDMIPDRITAKAIRCLLAYASYGHGDFDRALAQCDILDPDHGLDPADSSSWIVGGNSYGTFIEALLALITDLFDLYVDL